MKQLNLKLFTVIITIITLSSCSDMNRTEFYIAKDGNDNNSGSIESPFATLEKARDVIRERNTENKLPKGGYKVWLREGNYERERVFELNEKDSGTENSPIVYSAYLDEEVRISGGRVIDNSLVAKISDPAIKERIINKEAIDNIYQIDLKKAGITDYGEIKTRGFGRAYKNAPLELFINDKAMHLAKWPNNVKLQLGTIVDPGSGARYPENARINKPGTFTYDYNRPEKWKQANDIWVKGFFAYGYADDQIKVKHIDRDKKTIELASVHMYKLRSGREINKYYVLNLLEELDATGEYFVDREAGMLYFYHEGDISESRIVVSMLEEPLVAMEGVNNIFFENLIFENSRGIGIYIERGKGNKIVGCTLRTIGVAAVCIGKGVKPDKMFGHAVSRTKNVKSKYTLISRELGDWLKYIYADVLLEREAGTNNGVIDCEIYSCGAGGISLGGGSRKTLTPGGNYVRNCKIYNVNRLDRSYRAGVNIDGVGNRIEHCEIFDCTGSAIYLHGNDHIMEYNNIHHVLLEAQDMGAIYYGRDPSERGNIVRYNFFHHIDNSEFRMAVYLDDGASGMLIEGNVFYKAGSNTICINGGLDNKIINNIFVDNTRVLIIGGSVWADREYYFGEKGVFVHRLNYVGYNKPPYSTKYPLLANYFDREPEVCKGNLMKNNVIWGYNELIKKHSSKEDGWGTMEDNFITDEDPGFVDAKDMDFTLKDDSEVFSKIPDFKKIPFKKIGVRN